MRKDTHQKSIEAKLGLPRISHKINISLVWEQPEQNPTRFIYSVSHTMWGI